MKLVLILCIVFGSVSFAQVGIGTISPQEDLHIAGTTSSIRIESLNSTNNPTYNNGVDPAPVFIDGNGDIVLGNGSGPPGNEPFNFLIDVPNFITDDPFGLGVNTGSVVNSDAAGQTYVEGQITTVSFTVPQKSIVEVKYGATIVLTGNDLSAGPPYIYVTFDEAVTISTFFSVDVNSDGLDAGESAKKYGQKAQYYETNSGGSIGYPYMNGQAYLTLPAGTHVLHFYGAVTDNAASYTSAGFGGATDYLKIRVYN